MSNYRSLIAHFQDIHARWNASFIGLDVKTDPPYDNMYKEWKIRYETRADGWRETGALSYMYIVVLDGHVRCISRSSCRPRKPAHAV